MKKVQDGIQRTVPNGAIIVSILVARFIYSLNWFIISPALPSIAIDGHMANWMVGFVPLAFFAFTGMFQIPSGLVSNRIGSTNTFILGLVILSLGNMLIVLDPRFYWVFLTRAISGFGAALFFASAGGVLLGLKPERPGLMMGLYNMAFALGGGGGLVWGIVHEEFGWRAGMLLGGISGLVLALVNYLLTRGLDMKGKFSVAEALFQLRNRNILGMAFAFTGTWGTYLAVGQLLPTYLEVGLKEGIAVSGIESAPLLLSSVFGGLAAGVYDRTTHKRGLLLLSGILSILPTCFFGISSTGFIVISLIILGFFNELAISICYAFANNEFPERNTASFAVVNTVQILLGMSVLPLLSITAAFVSWSYAWVIIGTIPMIPLLIITKLNVK